MAYLPKEERGLLFASEGKTGAWARSQTDSFRPTLAALGMGSVGESLVSPAKTRQIVISFLLLPVAVSNRDSGAGLLMHGEEVVQGSQRVGSCQLFHW